MSSGQWEVVGKSKKTNNGRAKNARDDDRKLGPKLEDVLPHSQIKSFYSGMEIDDDQKPPQEKKKNGKKHKKEPEQPKPKLPKNLAEAFEAIDKTELANVITTNKLRFPKSPLVWLKEVNIFINSKTQIHVEDDTFNNQDSSYPLCLVPSDILQALEDVLNEAGKAYKLLLFEYVISALEKVTKEDHVNGNRIFIQLIAKDHPDLCLTAMQKNATHRALYQNPPPISESMLWAFGQGGRYDFSVGMKVWQDCFLPIMEQKNCPKYVTTYLSRHLQHHINTEGIKITQDQFLGMLDLVASKKGLIKDVTSDLIKQVNMYKDIFFKNSGTKLQVLFNKIMKKLPNQYLSGEALDPYNLVLVESLVKCLEIDDSCNSTWRQLFGRCSKQSATLICYIDSNLADISKRVHMKSLKKTLAEYVNTKQEIKGLKEEKVNKICQDILDMTTKRRFPWFKASFFLLLSIVGLVAYDVSRVSGDFPKSTTGKLFKDIGILEQSQYAFQKTLSTSARGYLWLETNAPIYYNTTVEICKPYGQLSKDAFIVTVKKAGILYGNVKDYVVEKTPVVVATIDQYVPGLIENVKGYTMTGVNFVKKYSCEYYTWTADYFKTKVFVGEWAPEILQNKTQIALNATRYQMTTYYHWFREQVNVYSEIP